MYRISNFKFPQVLQICLLPYPMLSSQGHTVSASWLQPVGEVRVRNNSDLENCREILLRKQTAVQCCRLTDFPPSPSLVLPASSPSHQITCWETAHLTSDYTGSFFDKPKPVKLEFGLDCDHYIQGPKPKGAWG